MKSNLMPRRWPALLALCACAARAADAPPADGDAVKIFRGQLAFMNSSIDFCVAQLPAMKDAFDDARDHAGEQIGRAEASLLAEAADNKLGYQPFFDTYAANWSKYAGQLLAALKRQDAKAACPDLLGNWQSTDADLVLEDWRSFIQRSGPIPLLGSPVDDNPHAAH